MNLSVASFSVVNRGERVLVRRIARSCPILRRMHLLRFCRAKGLVWPYHVVDRSKISFRFSTYKGVSERAAGHSSGNGRAAVSTPTSDSNGGASGEPAR